MTAAAIFFFVLYLTFSIGPDIEKISDSLERIADALEDYMYEDKEDTPNNNNVAK